MTFVSLSYHREDHFSLDTALQNADSEHAVILLAHQPKAAKRAIQSEYDISLILSGELFVFDTLLSRWWARLCQIPQTQVWLQRVIAVHAGDLTIFPSGLGLVRWICMWRTRWRRCDIFSYKSANPHLLCEHRSPLVVKIHPVYKVQGNLWCHFMKLRQQNPVVRVC